MFRSFSNTDWPWSEGVGLAITGIGLVLGLLFVGSIHVDGATPSAFTLDNHRSNERILLDALHLEIESEGELPFTFDSSENSLVSADVDGDGQAEVYYTSEDRIVRFDPVTKECDVLFPDLSEMKVKNFLFSDVDHDGTPECLVHDRSQNMFRCLDPRDGSEKWNVTTRRWLYTNPKVVQWEDYAQILLATDHNKVLSVDGYGDELWTLTLPKSDGRPYFAVSNIDEKGNLDLLVMYVYKEENGTWYLRSSIHDLITSKERHSSSLYLSSDQEPRIGTNPLVEDIARSHPGKEITIGLNTGIYLMNSELEVLWYIPRSTIGSNVRGFETVHQANGTFLTAWGGGRNIYSIDGEDGTVNWQLYEEDPSSAYPEFLWVGEFKPDARGNEVLLAPTQSVGIYNPLSNETWFFFKPEGYWGRPRLMCLAIGADEVNSILLLYNHDAKGYYFLLGTDSPSNVEITHSDYGRTIYPNHVHGSRELTATIPREELEWMVVDLYCAGNRGTLILDGSGWYYEPGIDGFEVFDAYLDGTVAGLCSVSFSIVMDWSFPSGSEVDLVLTVGLRDGGMRSFTLDGHYLYINELRLSGVMRVTDSTGNPVGESTWLKGGQNVAVSGLSLTFNGSDENPLPEDILLTVVSVPFSPGTIELKHDGTLVSTIQTSTNTTGLQNVSLRLVQEQSQQEFDIAFSFLVDPEPPEILAIYPGTEGWYGTDRVTVACNITDRAGSGLGDIQIAAQRATTRENVIFTPDAISRREEFAVVWATIRLEEGGWSLFWRISDLVGNGPVDSEIIEIDIDLTGVTFSGFQPQAWVTWEDVTASVIINDRKGSGVDRTSIDYRFSTDGLFGFSNWTNMELEGVGESVMVEIPLSLEDGIENYVVLRASDAVGNMRLSEVYHINVDTTPPIYCDALPMNRTLVDNGIQLETSITIVDATSGVNSSTVRYRYQVDEGAFTGWLEPEAFDGSTGMVMATIPVSGGYTISIQWLARDVANSGPALSSIIIYQVDQAPLITELLPGSPHHVYEGTRVSFRIQYIEPEDEEVTVTWSKGGEIVSNTTEFEQILPIGTHRLTVYLDDGHGNTVDDWIDVTVEEEPHYINSLQPLVSVILVVLIISLLSFYQLRKQRRKLRGFQSD